MKIFISWSGDLSNKVALILHEWLPSVIQSLEPYVSSENIDKGARWSTDISKELEDSSFGILCVTKDNIDAPWLVFEAGALSKSVEKSRVTPFLFGVNNADLQGPILQFQSTSFEEDDVRKLIHTINEAAESHNLDEGRINQIFDVWWPKLKESLDAIEIPRSAKRKKEEVASQEKSDSFEVLDEMLNLLRSQHRLLNSPEELLPRRYLVTALARTRHLPDDHPVYSALENAFDNLKDFVSDDSKEQVSVSEARQLVRSLEEPIEFILRRRGRALRRSLRLMD